MVASLVVGLPTKYLICGKPGEAEAELLSAARYYEGQAADLGFDFLPAVGSRIRDSAQARRDRS